MASSAPFETSCCGHISPFNPTVRCKFNDSGVDICAWPSRGGVIILTDAEAIDLEFLELNPLDPPVERLDDQTAEDEFCKRLLLLGAKWWDSEFRYLVVIHVEGGTPDLIIGKGFAARAQVTNCCVLGGGRMSGGVRTDDEPEPTLREKRFVSVGWPSTGGFWVAEFDTTWAGVDEEDNLVPGDAGRMRMARTMDERCSILRDHFSSTFYSDLEHYNGHAFLNSWQTKETGEVGALLQVDETFELWRRCIRYD